MSDDSTEEPVWTVDDGIIRWIGPPGGTTTMAEMWRQLTENWPEEETHE